MSIYVPKEGEGYFYISHKGICQSNREDTRFDIHNIKSGNCYRTKEDAIRAKATKYAKEEAIKVYYEYCKMGKTDNADTVCGFYYTFCEDKEFFKHLISKIGQDKVDLLATEE